MTMRQTATISAYGIYQHNNSIFDGLIVPAAVDRNLVINNILLESIDREILYPAPEMLKAAITIWSQKELPVWERLAKTLELEYDPIANYDRTETYFENYGEDGSRTTKNKSSEQTQGKTADSANTSATTTSKIENNGNTTTNETDNTENNLKVLETRDLHGSDIGNATSTSKDTVERDLSETVNDDTSVSNTVNTTGQMTGKNTAKDGGTDTQTTSKPGYNHPQGNINSEIVTNQYGKNTTIDDTQNSTNEEITKGSTVRTIETAQTGTTTDSKNTTDTHTNNTTDSGTVTTTNSGGTDRTVKNETTATNTETGNSGTTGSSKGEGSYNEDKTGSFNETEKENIKGNKQYNIRAVGNIGVTTTQQLIEQERQIAEFNIIDYISNSFIKRFCLLIY